MPELSSSAAERGRFALRLTRGDEVLAAGEVNPYRPDEVVAFVRRAFREVPGLRSAMTPADLRARLVQLAAPPPAPEPSAAAAAPHPYAATPGGLVWMKPGPRGPTPVPLTNFDARIVGHAVVDDGAGTEAAYEVWAKVAGAEVRLAVTATQFASMSWVARLGPAAIVQPGKAERARVAIQSVSGLVPTRTAYGHTGWRDVAGVPVYLHAGGAIGAGGAVEGVDVRLPDALRLYALPAPPPPEELACCVRASLGLLEAAPATVAVPVLCAVYRAALGPCDGALFLAGGTGARKSEFASLAQRHYGAGMDRLNLPANWSSTENALEAIAFAAKDALLVVDDFAPRGSAGEVNALHGAADRLFRAQGNQAGRQRLGVAGDVRAARHPRGLILATGEDVPRGASLRARLLVVEVGPRDVDLPALAGCQRDAAAGLYAGAMSGYVRWLAGRDGPGGEWRVWRVCRGLADEVAALRDSATSAGLHGRTPDLLANLALGLRHFLAFAVDAGAVTKDEAGAVWERAWAALLAAGRAQVALQASADPVRRFLDLIAAALASGSAYLDGPGDGPPADPAAAGWRKGSARGARWEPAGTRVGWADGPNVYLDPQASYAAAQAAAAGGERIAVSAQTLRKRLAEARLLIREGARDELTVRRRLGGTTRHVLYLVPNALLTSGGPPRPDKPAAAAPPPAATAPRRGRVSRCRPTPNGRDADWRSQGPRPRRRAVDAGPAV